MILLSLFACQADATIEVAGADPFGDVRSVVWTRPQTTQGWMLQDGALDEWGETIVNGSIAFHTEPQMCEDAAETLRAWGEASVDLLGASANGSDMAALCEAVPAWLDRMAEADAARTNGEHRLSLGYCIGDICEQSIEAVGYDFGEGSSASWFGLLTYLDPALADGRYERAAAAWNVDACAFDADFVSAEADANRVWSAVDGGVTFDEAANEQVSGTVEGNFREDGEDAGVSVSGTFEVSLCEMPEVSDLVIVW